MLVISAKNITHDDIDDRVQPSKLLQDLVPKSSQGGAAGGYPFSRAMFYRMFRQQRSCKGYFIQPQYPDTNVSAWKSMHLHLSTAWNSRNPILVPVDFCFTNQYREHVTN